MAYECIGHHYDVQACGVEVQDEVQGHGHEVEGVEEVPPTKKRPRGRPKKGCEWDNDNGVWVRTVHEEVEHDGDEVEAHGVQPGHPGQGNDRKARCIKRRMSIDVNEEEDVKEAIKRSLEELKKEEKKFLAEKKHIEAKKCGYEVIEVEGEGDCQFLCMSHVLGSITNVFRPCEDIRGEVRGTWSQL